MSKVIYPIGKILKLIYPLNNNKANFNARCIVVDGKKVFPDYYNKLITSFVLEDVDEFIAVQWDKNNPYYNNAIDGFYHSARFEVDSDQTSFRVEKNSSLKNNENRQYCFKCGEETKVVQGFSSCYNVCPICKI